MKEFEALKPDLGKNASSLVWNFFALSSDVILPGNHHKMLPFSQAIEGSETVLFRKNPNLI